MPGRRASASRATSASLVGILDLPYDILFELFTLLSAVDIVRLLSTSRAFHALTHDESIWKHLSARYGLHDCTHFRGHSFYDVYARLLHTYGPLIGLWASDFPYVGEILEFRIDAGSAQQPGGIVGELWRFPALEPEEVGAFDEARLPTYRRVVRIGFDRAASSPSEAQREGDAGAVRLFCCSSRHGGAAGGAEQAHGAEVGVLGETRQSLYVHTRLGQSAHPDFPGRDGHRWHDAQRAFPRVARRRVAAVDQRARAAQVTHPRVPLLFTAPSAYAQPRAVALTCAAGCVEAQWPFIGFQNNLPFVPRYYPLRAEVARGRAPGAGDWGPQTLRGLWLAGFSLHGTEVLHVEWDGGWLNGWKVTGDENVPRGVCSWAVATGDGLRGALPGALREACGAAFGGLARCEVFTGSGTMSARGYMPHQRDRCPIVLGVVGPDEMRIFYPENGEASTMIRWKGRENMEG